ncbi:glycosyltransferase family 2 protein [Ideonella dechloratans]|uniref:glycosyltransferase family 2 protein n=1 Tax=Ideonella dechloratans TaxID=36863 RepID=UPI0035AF8AFF
MLAYKNSVHLSECLASLANQSEQCDVVVSTSTPNEYIYSIAKKYNFPVIENPVSEGIGADWNFALALAAGRRITLCHQDDVYHPDYANRVMEFFRQSPQLAMVFTNHHETLEDGRKADGLNVFIKRGLTRWAFGGQQVVQGRDVRRRLLGFGNPVSCPSVALNMSELDGFRFSEKLQINLDWDAWGRIAEAGGHLGYIQTPLVSHRVHDGSETSAGLRDSRREQEDVLMFERYWPKPWVRFIMLLYRRSYASNNRR